MMTLYWFLATAVLLAGTLVQFKLLKEQQVQTAVVPVRK